MSTTALQHRLATLDLFRGLVIFAMVCVNSLGYMNGTPWFLLHAPEHADYISFADLVFPAFIFMMGVSIPFAVERMLTKGKSVAGIVLHILQRGISLLFCGVLVMNAEEIFSEELSHMPYYLWSLPVTLGILFLFSDTSGMKWLGSHRNWRIGLRLTGAIIIAVMLVLFRGANESGDVVWMTTGWWGILGMIGWAYMAAGLSYLFLRKWFAALLALPVLMTVLYMGIFHGPLGFLNAFNQYFRIGELLGSHASIAAAGVIAGVLLCRAPSAIKKNAGWISLMGLVLYGAGSLLRPLHGANKDDGTAAYCLISAGIVALLFAAVYYLLENRRIMTLLNPVVVVGTNPLLAYFAPGVLWYATRATDSTQWIWPFYMQGGWLGGMNVVCVNIGVFAVVWFLTKRRFMIRL